MSETQSNWEGSPEKRIIREIYLTKEGGLEPGTRSTEYGRVYESVLIRELRRLAQQQDDTDIRFARGYVVEDYGVHTSEGVSAEGVRTVQQTGPRFDIVCYRGNVAWTAFDGVPHAVVPESFVYGVIEAKRTLSPGYFPVDSSRAMNKQFRDQRDYLNNLRADIPLVVVGAHHRGTPAENRQAAEADHVAVLGDLSHAGSAEKMARKGELAGAVEFITK